MELLKKSRGFGLMRRLFSSFVWLNATQFLTALNDNLYKLLLIFFLITLQGEGNSNTILALAGAVFVIPFLLFASLAGSLADRFSKQAVIYLTRITEILTTSLGVLAFLLHSVIGGYAVLFLMAVQSTLFSPCKYGIIPEIVPSGKISNCNGILVATTYLAIIIGTFLASFFTEVFHRNFVWAGLSCVVFALLGWFTSMGIEKTPPQAERKKVSTRFLHDIFQTLKRAKKRRYLLTTLIFGAYFLFMGSYTQLNIIPFTLQSLHLSEIQGGYLFLMTAIGIGLGSYLAGTFSGKDVELGFVPLAAFGVTLCLLGLYFFQSHFFVVVPLLIVLGLFGGFYIVPVDAFIQVASPDQERGQNVATGNFLSFVGVIIASGLLALLGNALKLTAAEGFLIIGLFTFVIAVALLLLFADQVVRLCVARWARGFLHIKVLGKKRLDAHMGHPKAPVLLVAPRLSWLDTVIVMATLPRLIRYIVPVENGEKRHSLFYRLLWLIPIDIEHFSPLSDPTLRVIRNELETGNSVCLMHPATFPAKTLREWEANLEKLLKDVDVPTLPIHISKQSSPPKKGLLSQLSSLRKGVIHVSYGAAKEY
jgi:acyl-[acyl-carrier-protein]-phospholipid O-acyltransferase / long-chain-fatty-acid--[acyl-carrier-protein] ligase